MADVKRDKTNLQEHLDVTVRAELVEHDDPLLLVGPQLDGEIQVCRSLNGKCYYLLMSWPFHSSSSHLVSDNPEKAVAGGKCENYARILLLDSLLITCLAVNQRNLANN